MWPELAQALATDRPVVAYGTTPAWAAWLVGALPDEMVVVVAPDDAVARDVERDTRFFAPALDVATLPGVDVSPYAELSPDRDAIVARVATLYRLTQPALRPRVIITSAEALARTTMPPGELAARGLALAAGDTIDRDELARKLVSLGWTRTPVVDEIGTFAIRGEIVDLYAPLAPHPVRLELFGDTIEALRLFDAESQRTLRPIDIVHLHPVRDTIPTGTGEPRARIRAYADDIAHPTKATRRLIEQLETGEIFIGIEGLMPAFHDAMVAPATYVPAGARWIVIDPAACRRVVADLHPAAAARFDERRATGGFAYPPALHFTRELAGARRVELPSLELHEDDRAIRLRVGVDDLRVLRQELEHARTFGDTTHADPLLAAIKRWRADGLRIAIAADSQSRADRLIGVLTGRGLTVRTAPPNERPTQHADVTVHAGAPSASFASPNDGVALVTTSDIFGKRVHHSTAKKRAKDALLGGVQDFGALRAGDYLVHQRHGVGRYQGLERLQIQRAGAIVDPSAPAPQIQHAIDCLELEYDGGTLYLPVYRLGEVQRYVGAEGHAPRLDKLGGVTWEATTNKVARSVRALAEELLQLYAQRAAMPGHRFPPADDTFRELEATFPFDETPDQAAAIDAVLADMEAGRAMDRLVCGDVGYGKTEVAMRAIFRCIQGGKQAAVLAPTTVLVEQHARTIAERFAPFAVSSGKLSRFQSKAEQIDTIKRLVDGKLDVVVGTHRMLSADVRFKDLGLLVIDEEQRFGVAHKERIKKTRTQVDVLTLTATPIPRTLHLAMAGMRDLSIIATPPADRRAVRTLVSRVDDHTIETAIKAELARGGQVFFITPTIGNMPVQEPDPRLPNESRPRRLKMRDDDRTIDEWAAYLREARADRADRRRPRLAVGRGAREGDGPVHRRRPRCPGRDDDRRERPRHPTCEHDVRRARRCVRARPALPAARPHRPVERARVLLLARTRARAHHRRGPPPTRGAAALHGARRRLPDRLARPRDPRRRRAARQQAVRLDRRGRLRPVRQDARALGRRARRQADPQRDRSRADRRHARLHPRRLRARSRPAPRAVQAAQRDRGRRRAQGRDDRDRRPLRRAAVRRDPARRADEREGAGAARGRDRARAVGRARGDRGARRHRPGRARERLAPAPGRAPGDHAVGE